MMDVSYFSLSDLYVYIRSTYISRYLIRNDYLHITLRFTMNLTVIVIVIWFRSDIYFVQIIMIVEDL